MSFTVSKLMSSAFLLLKLIPFTTHFVGIAFFYLDEQAYYFGRAPMDVTIDFAPLSNNSSVISFKNS